MTQPDVIHRNVVKAEGEQKGRVTLAVSDTVHSTKIKSLNDEMRSTVEQLTLPCGGDPASVILERFGFGEAGPSLTSLRFGVAVRRRCRRGSPSS